MTYQPGGPGYPPQPQQNQFNAPNPQYGRAPERIPAAPAAPAGPSNLPTYLSAAVAVLGLLVFGFNFADPFGLKDSYAGNVPRELISHLAAQRSILTFLPAIAAVSAALLAGVGLLPKQKNFKAWVAILSVLGLLLAIVEIAQVSDGLEVKWGLYSVLVLTVLQAGCALAALLLDAGVIQPPAPKPQSDPYGYGAPGQYYGQPPLGAPQQAPQVRPDYGQQGQQYGQPSGYPLPGAPIGGYHGGRPQHTVSDDSSPVTPPTGFSAFGPSASAPTTASEAVSGYPGASGASAATSAAASSSDATQTFKQQQAPQQSDPASS